MGRGTAWEARVLETLARWNGRWVKSNTTWKTLGEDEEEALIITQPDNSIPINFENCFVGRFLTSGLINFQAMRVMLANVWHPIDGISITELGEGRYQFRLYHENGENPMVVALDSMYFWVLVNNLPVGYISEQVARQFGNFIGSFVEYDASVVTLGYRGSIRMRSSAKTKRSDVESMVKGEGLWSGFTEYTRWSCTGFYGALEENRRSESWDLLHRLNNDPDIPWLVIDDCGLYDIGYSRAWYTWERGNRVENKIRERLDREGHLLGDGTSSLKHTSYLKVHVKKRLFGYGMKLRVRSRRSSVMFPTGLILEVEDESRIEGELGLEELARDYFQKLFASTSSSIDTDILHGIPLCITAKLNSLLLSEFLLEEVT
ncbi:hypothetical protein F3Y22_tig00111191pilonHSYRG00123 [Hibiscus syriacus]|uniref:DUF4283 domain-containing protein n=1 Tax=Hibiscus syriacus TaxID=106335 RepID=A0A6A2YWL2_HIBSY|nr:hypothetical protein F3Y22_tig00111191pilonHSYRG00123 [Hibiscus syriacus]